MSSIITSVILPGIGPVCPECFSRGHIAALPLSPNEVYSFGVTEPDSGSVTHPRSSRHPGERAAIGGRSIYHARPRRPV
jgi:hypothetical protein